MCFLLTLRFNLTFRNLRMVSSLYVGINVRTSFVPLAANALLAFIGVFWHMLEYVAIGYRRIEMLAAEINLRESL
jgi:hypothetical protein